MKNQKIKEKVMKRLLSKNYPKQMLHLLKMIEESTRKEEALPTEVFGSNLEGSNLEAIRQELRQELIDQVKAEKTYYELGVLFLALSYLSHEDEKQEGFDTNDPKITFCQNFIKVMQDVCIGEDTMKMAVKALKDEELIKTMLKEDMI